MPLTTRTHNSGLVLAEEAFDEARVSRALKQIDDRFVLQKRCRDEERGGVLVYKVVCVVNDHYAPVVFTWMDEHGRPLPLSSGLVDEVQRHVLGGRGVVEDEDAFNARLVETRRREQREQADAIYEDHRGRLERGQMSVSLAYRARKPEFLKQHRGRLAR